MFIPVLFMGGILGRLLREFAVTISVAILVSGVVSLTLTPMLASRFLRSGTERRGRLFRATERGFEALVDLYRRTLDWSLGHRAMVMLGFVASVVVTALVFMVIRTGFVPSADTGQVVAFTEGPQDISFEGMARQQQAASAIIDRHPAVQSYVSVVGAGGPAAGETLGSSSWA